MTKKTIFAFSLIFSVLLTQIAGFGLFSVFQKGKEKVIRIWVWDPWGNLMQCHTASSNSENSWLLSTYNSNLGSFFKSGCFTFFFKKRQIDSNTRFIPPPPPRLDKSPDDRNFTIPKHFKRNANGGMVWASPMDSMEFKSELKKGYQNTPDALGTDGMHFEYYVRYGKERYNFKIHSIFTNSRERGIEFLSDVTAEIINEGLLGNYHLYKPHLQDG